MFNRLVPDVFKTPSRLNGRVYPAKNNLLKHLESFDQAAFSGAIIADKDCERGEADHPAIANGLKIIQAERLQRQFGHTHFINPLFTSR